MGAPAREHDEISDAIAARTIDSRLLVAVGRTGWVAKGVVYVLIGLIAIPIAVPGSRASGEEASRTGALAEIADTPFGGPALLAVAVGLAIYGLWRLTTALMPGDDSDVSTWAHRAAYLFSAAFYGFLAWSAVSIATTGSGGDDSGDGSMLERLSRWMLERAGGRWVLALGAIGGLGVAAYFAYRGVDRAFDEQLDLSDAGSTERSVIEGLGLIGWIGRAISVALMSVFVLTAAIRSDPSEAEGLGQALRDTADTGWGAVLVLVAGAALVAYGCFAAVSARRRRLVGP